MKQHRTVITSPLLNCTFYFHLTIFPEICHVSSVNTFVAVDNSFNLTDTLPIACSIVMSAKNPQCNIYLLNPFRTSTGKKTSVCYGVITRLTRAKNVPSKVATKRFNIKPLFRCFMKKFNGNPFTCEIHKWVIICIMAIGDKAVASHSKTHCFC